MLNATNPMLDAMDIIRGTDVISDEKKRVLFQGLNDLRRHNCPPPEHCAQCQTSKRCMAAIADLLGS